MNDRSNDWSAQAERLYMFLLEHPNKDHPAPVLNQAAAGDGSYIVSFTKRCSEVRRQAERDGHEFVKSVDKWVDGQRQTAYRLNVKLSPTWKGSPPSEWDSGTIVPPPESTALLNALERDLRRFDAPGAALPAPEAKNAPCEALDAANRGLEGGVESETEKTVVLGCFQMSFL